MEPQERELKYQKQTQELYAAVGKFAVKFEHVRHAMDEAIILALYKNGVSNQNIALSLIAPMSAEQLRQAWESVIYEATESLTDDERKLVHSVSIRIQQLITDRNNILHRTWFVGWASSADEDFSSTSGYKVKNTGKGVEFKVENYTVANFDNHSAVADELANLVRGLCSIIIYGGRISDNFVMDNGIVRRRSD